jgi:hypothetical protein
MTTTAGIADDIARLLDRELESFGREIGLFSNDDDIWRTLPGVTNSVGNLAMHVAGGLQHFVGEMLGHTGYTRDRELEFNRRSGSRADVIAELDRARAVVRQVVPRLTDDVLSAPFPGPFPGPAVCTRLFLVHLCTHAAMHLGQAGYLRRALTGDATSSEPVPMAPLERRGN